MLRQLKLLIFALLFCTTIFCQSINDWTWCYRKKFSLNQLKGLINKPNVTFTKVNVKHYNQLIFSWNAYRPTNGYLRFWVQPRDAATKSWGAWHKMIDWGTNIQQSYASLNKTEPTYVHVRLEMNKYKLADGFRLKVEAVDGADLSYLRMLNVCVSDFSKFRHELIDKNLNDLPTIKITDIPKKSQMVLEHAHNRKMCSPTSTSMLISYLSKKNIDPVDFALKVYDNGLQAYGSWPFNTAGAFEMCPSCFFRVVRLNSFADLHALLTLGMPVVVSVRGHIKGAPQDYNSGHLLLVIGWDKKTKSVLVNDPAFEHDNKVEHRYDISSFLKAWEKSHRLAYITQKR